MPGGGYVYNPNPQTTDTTPLLGNPGPYQPPMQPPYQQPYQPTYQPPPPQT
jgi:hypothetical protein